MFSISESERPEPEEKALKEFEEKLDKEEAANIKEKITAIREVIAKAQSGDNSVTSEALKEQTDALQNASLTLFDKMHRARAEQSQEPAPNAEGGLLALLGAR